jgi:hypothetical protein
MANWIYSHSSVIGSGHAKTGTPCQDSCSVKESADGKWLAIVVSDGAGSAKHSDISSNFVTHFFSESLISLSKELDIREPSSWINDYVIDSILKVRNELRAIAKSDDLRSYHCTLVACLIGDTGGFLIHIGDGAVFGGKSMSADLKRDYFSSLPENGEYSNETFFITEGDWIKHLRITPINSVDWILLATDGGTSLSMINDSEPKWGFVVPLFKLIKNEKNLSARNEKLTLTLADSQADKLTSDDKTICIAFRKDLGVDEITTIPTESSSKNESQPVEKHNLVDKPYLEPMPVKEPSKKKVFIKRFIKYTLMILLAVAVVYLGKLSYFLIKGFFN